MGLLVHRLRAHRYEWTFWKFLIKHKVSVMGWGERGALISFIARQPQSVVGWSGANSMNQYFGTPSQQGKYTLLAHLFRAKTDLFVK